MLSKLLREPFVHFVLLGLFIYGLVETLSPAAPALDERTIVITNDDLVTFMQKRDQVFDADLYQAKLAGLDDSERRSLLNQLIEQEVLYREAKNLGLDQNDDVMRRRMVQKLKYFLQGFSQATVDIEDQQVAAYYEQNKADYEIPANITFTHLFFKDDATKPPATQRALQALQQLNRSPNDGQPPASDHFPYHRNYVRKSAAQVARHFGREFAAAVFDLQSGTDTWQGPLSSAYGQHLVQIKDRQAAVIPQLAEVEQRVQEDLRRDRFAEARQAQINELVKQYRIEVEQE